MYTGIFSNFQYLVDTGMDNDDTGISCVPCETFSNFF